MNNKSLTTKTQAVLEHLKEGNTLTVNEILFLFNCSSGTQRIKENKKRGYTIKTTRIVTAKGDHIGRYSLLPELCNFNSKAELDMYVYKVTHLYPTTYQDLKEEINQYNLRNRKNIVESLFD